MVPKVFEPLKFYCISVYIELSPREREEEKGYNKGKKKQTPPTESTMGPCPSICGYSELKDFVSVTSMRDKTVVGSQ